MKNRTLVALPVLALVGFLAIKPPAIGTQGGPNETTETTASSTVEVFETPTQSKQAQPKSSQTNSRTITDGGSLTASTAPSESTEELSPATPPKESAPLIAPPVIRGDDDDYDDDYDDDNDDDYDDDDDDDDHHDRRHHDDD